MATCRQEAQARVQLREAPRTRRACRNLQPPHGRAERILPVVGEDADSDPWVLTQGLLPWSGPRGTPAQRGPGVRGMSDARGRETEGEDLARLGWLWVDPPLFGGWSATGWGHGLEEEGLQECEAGGRSGAPGRCPGALSPSHRPTHPSWASRSTGDEAQSSGGHATARLPSRSRQDNCLKAPGMDSSPHGDASRLDPPPCLPSWIIKRFQSLHIIGRPQRTEV